MCSSPSERPNAKRRRLNRAALLVAKRLAMLTPGITDLVPACFRIDPDMVSNLEPVATLGNQPGRNKHPFLIINARQARTARAAEPCLPVGIRFLPVGNQFLAACPAEVLVVDNKNRNSVAAG